MQEYTDLTQGSIGNHLLRLTLPLTVGMFSIISVNLVDTYFVAKLGTQYLAAISFTFPVIMFMISIAIGIGTGAAALLSRSIGNKSALETRKLTSDNLFLTVLTALCLSMIGLATFTPLFKALGAPETLLPFIHSYMKIWYGGALFMILPIVCNHSLRASGETRLPSMVMVTAAVLNALLDPILVFGLGPFPRLELCGAATASVIARMITTAIYLGMIHFRMKALTWPSLAFKQLWHSWSRILHIALPSTLTNMFLPLGWAVVTRLISSFGEPAVAALGTGSRIQAFALIFIFALSSAVIPMTGQNMGAGRWSRLRIVIHKGNQYAAIWGICSASLLIIFSPCIASLFTDDPAVLEQLYRFLWIVPVSYILLGIAKVIGASLNAIGYPVLSSLISAARVFLFSIPLAWIASRYWGSVGIFLGMSIGNMLAGIISIGAIKLIFRKHCT